MSVGPGVHADVPLPDYLTDPTAEGSLSSSEARLLLDSPAKFRWRRENRVAPTSEMSLGSAAHRLVLGVGDDIETVDAENWRTKAAREHRDAILAAGRIPLLPPDMDLVEQMAKALREHPVATKLLDPDRGEPEQVLVWRDDASGVTCRARLDWLPKPPKSGRLIVPDYKTTYSAKGPAFAASAAKYGYHQQAAWYLDAVSALCGATAPAFVFVVQEKEPPFLVNVVELDPFALQIGAVRNQEARVLYRQCVESGEWPGFGPDVEMVALPRWAELEFERSQDEEGAW